jgi:type VI secretion system protein ImpH
VSYLADLAAEPYRFDFFEVLRRFERSRPDRPRIGDSGARDEEVAILGQDPFVDFPASNLSSFDSDARGRARILCRFLGLLGPQGALPLHTTVEAKRWSDAHDDSFARFLDIFHHRFLQLFFRAWADAQPVAQHDHPEDDRFKSFAGAAVGIATRPYRDRDSVSDLAKLSLAGLMAPAVKSASRIENIVAFLFGAEVEVEQFTGMWLPLESGDRTALSARHCGLGRDTLVGAAVYSVGDKFTLRIVARTLAQFEAFLPNGEFCERLADAIYFYLGDLLDYDVEIAIPTRETRPVELGRFGRLGWTSWTTQKVGADREGMRRDCRFHPTERAAARRAETRPVRQGGG